LKSFYYLSDFICALSYRNIKKLMTEINHRHFCQGLLAEYHMLSKSLALRLDFIA